MNMFAEPMVNTIDFQPFFSMNQPGIENTGVRTQNQELNSPGSPRAYADLFAYLQAEQVLPAFSAGGQVLDCNIGTVAFSLELINLRVQLDGIDITPRMFFPGAGRSGRAQVQVTMHYGMNAFLPYPTDMFDLAVTSAPILSYLDNPRRRLTELSRVLRPGAPLLIVFPRWNNRRQPATDPDPTDMMLTPPEVCAWMEAGGLQTVRQYAVAGNPALVDETDLVCVGITRP
ncbi:MAG: class I SAM-dependent methyltransferase [Chloroflexaceae bacterium]